MNISSVVVIAAFSIIVGSMLLVTNPKAVDGIQSNKVPTTSPPVAIPEASPVASPQEKKQIEFRLTEKAFVEGLTQRDSVELSESSGNFYPHKKPFLTNHDIAEANIGMHNSSSNDAYYVDLYLTRDGAKKMGKSSAENLEKPVLIFSQGKLISTYTPMFPLSDWVLIYGPFTKAKATMIASSIKTEPATGPEFLKPYPNLYGLSLEMTEPKFLEFAKRHELGLNKTSIDGKKQYSFSIGDGHGLIVMFDESGETCQGIQRVRNP